MYLTRAGWGIVVKRIPEHIMSLLPMDTLSSYPNTFGIGSHLDG